MDQAGQREQSIPEGINLARLLRYVLPRTWVVLVLGIISSVVALIWALYIVPEFKGVTRFEILSEQEGISMAAQLSGLTGGGFLGENKGRPEVVRIMGIELSRQTVHELGLEINVIDPRDTFWGRAKEKIGGKLGMSVRPPVDLAPIVLAEIEMADRYDGHKLQLKALGGQSFEILDPEGMFGSPGAVVLSGRDGDRFVEDELSFIVKRSPPDADKGMVFDLMLRREAEWLRDFRSRIKAGTDRNASHIVSVEFNHPYPEVIRKVLETMMGKYQQGVVDQRAQSTRQKLEWIDMEMQARQEELDAAQQAFYDYREKSKAIEITVQTQSLIEQLALYDQQVTQTDFIKRGYDDLLTKLNSGDEEGFLASPLVANREDATLSLLVQQLVQARMDREALLLTLTEKHSNVQTVETQIAELRDAIRTHIENSREQLADNLSDVQGKQGTLLAQADKLPATERELLELSREYEKQLGLMTFLQQQKTETELTMAALAANVRFIDIAEVGKQAFKPRVMMSVVAGSTLGLGAGVVALFFMFLGHTQVFDEEDAGEAAPVIAVLTSRNSKARMPLLAGVLAGRGGGAGILLHNTPGYDTADFALRLHEKARSLGRRSLGLTSEGAAFASAVGKPLPTLPASFSIADSEASSSAINSPEALAWLREAAGSAEVIIAGPPNAAESPLAQQLAMGAGSCSLVAVRGVTRRGDLIELARQLRLGGLIVVGVVLVDRSVLQSK